ncbi:MAG: hypothetical protein ACRDTF_24445 [Pseudonocardiaceae bacterium]
MTRTRRLRINGTPPRDSGLSHFRIMGRWTRDRLSLAVGVVLVGGAIGGTAWAYRLPQAERGDALALLGIALAVVGVLPLVMSLRRRAAEPRPVDELADLLARAVSGQWRQEATQRRLLTPEPIPIRWSLSDLDVTGPVTAAVGTPGTPVAFPPLPGQAAITEADLRAGGGRGELHRLYAGLASGRIVVVGGPGAGKTGAAILLLLDALEHRARIEGPRRARIPVPVLLTAHGWDPTTTSVQDWLVGRLAETYPLFQRHGGPADAAALAAAADQVTLLLDGLDEMDKALRSAALQALGDAPFRVVVLTRSKEMVQATSDRWLVGAVAVHLHDVTVADAADYLHRACTGPPPSGWSDLLAHLRSHPKGVLARGLSTPLTLTLLRDTYQPGDVSELLDPTRHRTSADVEHHLIARILPAAYTPRPGRPAPRYTEQQARHTLTFIARQLGTNRDLAWWHIPRWAPAIPRVLATGLAFGLAFGLVFWLGGLVPGLGVRLGSWVVSWIMSGLGGRVLGSEGWVAGGWVAGWIVFGLGGLVFGLMGWLMGWLVGWRRGGEPQRVNLTNWRVVLSRRVLGQVLAGWIVGGLVFGPSLGFVVGLAVGLAVGLIESSAVEGMPLGPREIWRNDRNAGLVVGLVVGLAYTFLLGLVLGLTVGLMFGLAVGVTYSKTWTTSLAWLQLLCTRRVPVVRLMPFLEDAQKRNILRSVGAVYQFRHAILQDYLASQGTSASSAVPDASPTR